MGSISEKGFGLIQMHLSNEYYNAVFEKSKLLKWFPDIIGLHLGFQIQLRLIRSESMKGLEP